MSLVERFCIFLGVHFGKDFVLSDFINICHLPAVLEVPATPTGVRGLAVNSSSH